MRKYFDASTMFIISIYFSSITYNSFKLYNEPNILIYLPICIVSWMLLCFEAVGLFKNEESK